MGGLRTMRTLGWVITGLWTGLFLMAGTLNGVVLQVDRNTDLDPTVIYEGIEILADDIEINGNGAYVRGPGACGEAGPEGYVGVGVLARGRSGVVLRGLRVQGFSAGLWAENGRGWVIEECDFSDNYHNPEHGWGDGERQGGVILTNMHESGLLKCRGNRVWNGLDMRGCNDNRVVASDFSHCSNVGLRLWNSSRNTFQNNDFSYGLRIAPGEVHARDSTGVLIESGSNDNRLIGNDVTHGGDGIFIRPLNGWVSTGNIFIENDCSYANNNGIESWSPGNVFIRNRANHCSYGFWLGGSDRTVLRDNEASFNGLEDGFHNAPEPDFGHGGIVIVNGTGYHTVIEDNLCQGNNGGGIVFRGDLGTRGGAWRMQHLIVQGNRLEGNRWGIFARFADDIFFSNNRFTENEENLFMEDVTGVTRGLEAEERWSEPGVAIEGPDRVEAGSAVLLRAVIVGTDQRRGTIRYRWRIGDQVYEGAMISLSFPEPGFNRVSLTVDDGVYAGMAFKEIYATESDDPFCEGPRPAWIARLESEAGFPPLVQAGARSVVGAHSVEVKVAEHPGGAIRLELPLDGMDLSGAEACAFWLSSVNAVQAGYYGAGPILGLESAKGALAYSPHRDGEPVNLLSLGGMPYPEAREGWVYVEIPLAGSSAWRRRELRAGERTAVLRDGLVFETRDCGIATAGDTAMTAVGDQLFMAVRDEDRLYRSSDGVEWEACRAPGADLGSTGGGWENGALAVVAGPGESPVLVMRRRAPEGADVYRYVLYDIETDRWRWTPVRATAGVAYAGMGDLLFGIAHAVGGNYGGPLCRARLSGGAEQDARSVPSGLGGVTESAWWFSRAAQLAVVGEHLYGIKNDWVTPAPEGDATGDRLFRILPGDYVASEFSGTDPWAEESWTARETPVTDLGALPFEVGQGSTLVPLPPQWCPGLGPAGGLWIGAGNSPSNHEGWGAASDRFCIYSLDAQRVVLDGRLPSETGAGTSAVFWNGRVVIKRGGGVFEEERDDLWFVRPVQAGEKVPEPGDGVDLERIDRLSIELPSRGGDDVTIWVDGLHFRKAR